LGAGALSNSHRPALAVLPGAVKIPGGYRYVARPGDTLWSIATKLQPGADPRVLVANLEQQIHGGELIAGDQLKLP
jgi:Tfp pilus assembly protein FimV